LVPLILLLCLVQVIGSSLEKSQEHTFPIYDEVVYLENAREIREKGGILRSVLSYIKGEDVKSFRHPLNLFLLSIFTSRSPTDFTFGKLLSLFQCLILISLVIILSKRMWGAGVGLLSGLLLSFSPTTTHLSHFLLVDILFSIFYFLFLAQLITSSDRLNKWCLVGCWIGLAYLSKGSGHFLFISVLVVGIYRWRAGIFKRKEIYICIFSFLAVSSFLLIRNSIVFGGPFHHVNNNVFWLDSQDEVFIHGLFGTFSQVGPQTYFQRHDLLDALIRFGLGLKKSFSLLFLALGVSSFGKPGDSVIGAVFFLLSLYGFSIQWKKGHKESVLAVGSIFIFFFSTFSFFIEQADRYIYPLAVSLVPFVSIGILQLGARIIKIRKPPKKILWPACACVVLLIGAVTFQYRAQAAAHPLHFYRIPGNWKETGDWIKANQKDEKYASNTWSYFSTWYCCPDKREVFPFLISRSLFQKFMEKENLRTILLDQPWVQGDPFRDKYGPLDQFGPTSMMGLERCYHDDRQPSRFLIYSDFC